MCGNELHVLDVWFSCCDMRLVVCLLVLVSTWANAQVPANFQTTIDCDNLYRQTAPIASTKPPSEITLDYSVADISALGDLDSRFSDELLISSSAKYARFVYTVPSYSNQSFVTTDRSEIQYLGDTYENDGRTYGSVCLLQQTDCSTNICQQVETLPIRIYSSPVRMVYRLTPIVQVVVPFSFQPIDSYTPSSICTSAPIPTPGASSCSSYDVASSGLYGACSSPDAIQSIFGDTYNGTANCGAYSDPGLGFSTQQFNCLTTCVKCPGATTPLTEHRRWWSNPTCSVWQITSEVSWDALVGIVVGNGTNIDTLVFEATKSFGIVVGKNRLIRAFLTQNYLFNYKKSLQPVSGFIVACNYSDPNAIYPINQGLFNPYINVSAAVAAAKAAANGDAWKLILADMISAGPVNLSPSQRGAGKVPTYNSTGQVSIFYIPGSISKNARTNSYPNQNQMISLLKTANLLACNNGNLNECYKGLPGWYVDPTTGNYSIPSICQLSSNVNQYAATYQANMASGPTAGDPVASIPNGSPLGLLPLFNISQPNVWLNGSNLIIDPGERYPFKAAFSFALDVSYDMLTFVNSASGVKITSGRESCIYDNKSGNGTAMFQITNQNEVGSPPIDLELSFACAWYYGNLVLPAAVNYTGSPSIQIESDSVFTTSAFLITSPPLTNGSLECNFTLAYTSSTNLPSITQPIACGLVANYELAPYPTPEPNPTGLPAGSIVGIAVVSTLAGLSLLGIIVIIGVAIANSRKSGKRD